MRQEFIISKYKKIFQTSLILVLLCNGQTLVSGQNWQWVKQFGTSQSETVDAMQTDQDGNLYLSGKFKDSFAWGTTILQSIGKDDTYLTKLDPLGNPIWSKRGGSSESDESIAVAIDPAGNIYQTGLYWFASDFGSVALTASVGSRAIYLVKYDEEGAVLWGKSIDGTAGKTVSGCAVDADGNVYLSGSFAGELKIDGTSLMAGPKGDIFVAKFTATGGLLWVEQLTASVSIKSVTLTVSPEGEALIAGQFIGTVNVANDSFTNITGDNDVFLVKYAADGTALWGRKAGGVYEDDCSQIRTDAAGNVFLTGTFLGVLELSADVQIQTEGFNNNFYLLKYNPDGAILWARSLGGGKADAAEDLIINESMLVVSGYFTESMSIDGITVTGNENIADGFIAAFDLDGTARKIQTIESEGFVIPSNLNFTPSGEIISSGVFENTAQFGEEALTATGLFDLYLARLGDTFTAIQTAAEFRNQFQLFPNPTAGNIFVQTEEAFTHYEIYDIMGRDLVHGKAGDTIDLSTFEAGIYFIRLINALGQQASFKIQKY